MDLPVSNGLPDLPQVHGIASTSRFDTDIEEEDLQNGKLAYGVVGRGSDQPWICGVVIVFML